MIEPLMRALRWLSHAHQRRRSDATGYFVEYFVSWLGRFKPSQWVPRDMLMESAVTAGKVLEYEDHHNIVHGQEEA